MALEVRAGNIRFEPRVGGVNRDPHVGSEAFSGTVRRDSQGRPLAWAAVNGFTVKFVSGDQNFGSLTLDLNVRKGADSRTVEVTGQLGLRDASGIFDDRYSGSINYIVIADVE